MNKSELKQKVNETIYENGAQRIRAIEHNSMLRVLIDSVVTEGSNYFPKDVNLLFSPGKGLKIDGVDVNNKMPIGKIIYTVNELNLLTIGDFAIADGVMNEPRLRRVISNFQGSGGSVVQMGFAGLGEIWTRVKPAGGPWEGWTRRDSNFNYRHLIGQAELDTFLKPGVASVLLENNDPILGNSEFSVLCLQSDSEGGFHQQIAIVWNNGWKMYIRGESQQSFGEWEPLGGATTIVIPELKLSMSGDNLRVDPIPAEIWDALQPYNPRIVLMRRSKRSKRRSRSNAIIQRITPKKTKWVICDQVELQDDGFELASASPERRVNFGMVERESSLWIKNTPEIVKQWITRKKSAPSHYKLHGGSCKKVKYTEKREVFAPFGLSIIITNPNHPNPESTRTYYRYGVPAYLVGPVSKITFRMSVVDFSGGLSVSMLIK